MCSTVKINSDNMKEFDSVYDFTEEMSVLFGQTIGSDYYNGSSIEFEIELLNGYDDRNRFIQYLIEEKGCELNEEVEVYYHW